MGIKGAPKKEMGAAASQNSESLQLTPLISRPETTYNFRIGFLAKSWCVHTLPFCYSCCKIFTMSADCHSLTEVLFR